MKSSFIFIVCGMCLMSSCSTFHSVQNKTDTNNIFNANTFYNDDGIEVVRKKDADLSNTIYIVYDGFEIAKYHLIGTIQKGLDTIHFVQCLFFFNIEESTRCNNKMLIYRNKNLMGYYNLGGDDFHFEVIDNMIVCNPKDNLGCKVVLDFNPDQPNDWFIPYSVKDGLLLGDSVSFERCNFDMYYDYLPNRLMFINQ